jgi:hypothetical protein
MANSPELHSQGQTGLLRKLGRFFSGASNEPTSSIEPIQGTERYFQSDWWKGIVLRISGAFPNSRLTPETEVPFGLPIAEALTLEGEKDSLDGLLLVSDAAVAVVRRQAASGLTQVRLVLLGLGENGQEGKIVSGKAIYQTSNFGVPGKVVLGRADPDKPSVIPISHNSRVSREHVAFDISALGETHVTDLSKNGTYFIDRPHLQAYARESLAVSWLHTYLHDYPEIWQGNAAYPSVHVPIRR